MTPSSRRQLPYWDRLPLIFPIEIYPDGFLGINLHYLPPMYRAKLMDALYGILTGSTPANQRLLVSMASLRVLLNIGTSSLA
jgi:hypothetical protein